MTHSPAHDWSLLRYRMVTLVALALCAGVVACNGPAAAPSVTPAPAIGAGATPGVTATLPASPPAAFPSGIVFARPGGGGPPLLHSLDDTLPVPVPVTGPGFALNEALAVTTRGDVLVLTRVDGSTSDLPVEGATQLARPALSPDGTRVALQALPRGGTDLDIFIVALEGAGVTRIPGHPWNDESPEWLPGANAVVYSSFSPEHGINAHIYDLDARAEVRTLPAAGAIHLAVSRDGARLLDPGRARIYDLTNGALLADLRAVILAEAQAAGFMPDTRFPGQADRGTFPLDGDFSPDGRALVFDGAVERNGEYGVIVFTTRLDGTGFEVVAGPYEVDPAQSNHHNFSQLNPAWLPPAGAPSGGTAPSGSSRASTSAGRPIPAPGSATVDASEWIAVDAPGGREILAAVFRPEGEGPWPAVVVLHGTNGFSERVLGLAADLAGHGFVAVAGCWFGGHYEGGTATEPARRIDVADGIDCPNGPELKGISSAGAAADVAALAEAAQGLPGVAGGAVVAVGHSRGSFAALVSATAGGPFRAVVASGGVPPPDLAPVSAAFIRVPVLILHGELDEVQPVEFARNFEQTLRGRGAAVQAHYFEGAPHGYIFLPKWRAGAVAAAATFLHEQLSGIETGATRR